MGKWKRPKYTKFPAIRGVPGWISSNGARVFFESQQSLVGADKNGVVDVYEWERAAVPNETDNTCTQSQVSPVTGGCTFLISGGESPVPSFLVGADATGENVFFTHSGPPGLVKAPVGQPELYDARVNGGFSTTSQACTGTGCQGVPPALPSFATPPSATFTGGVGNLPPGKRGSQAAQEDQEKDREM